MIVVALCITLGGVTFEKVDIPDIYVQRAMVLLGAQTSNFRHADIDADGHMDLILPTRVYLRPNGRLDPARFIPMPDVDSETRFDIWGQRLFFLNASSLTVYELMDGTWNQTLKIEHESDLQASYRLEPEEDRPPIAFERFLHDVDGDGRPEVLRVDDEGIAVSVVADNQLQTTHLDLFPRSRLLSYAGYDTLWPQSERRVSFPNRKAMFDVVINRGKVVVVERIRQKGGDIAFRIERYRVTYDVDSGFTLRHESSHQTEALPRHVLHALALNGDDIVDYFGYQSDRPTHKNWKPLVRGFASTDGGKTFQMATTRGFLGRALFIDLDGDGDKDWVGEESGLVSGGLRETANRALFQRKFTHTILARMQNKGGTFEPKWRTLGRFTIRFDETPRHLSYRFLQYRMGDLIDCTGDFNGDGWKDVLVCDRPGTVSLHLGGPKGFNEHPETKIDIPRNTIPVAIDIDGDGRSDVAIVKRGSYAPLEIYLNTERN